MNKKKPIELLKKKEKKPKKRRDNSLKPNKKAQMKLKSVNSKPLLNEKKKKLRLLQLSNLDWRNN